MPFKIKPYLQLVRLPNAFTAMADPLAGVLVVAGSCINQFDKLELAALLCISACLYTAGIVFNDLMDLDEDRLQRPERPLPSGQVSVRTAGWLTIWLIVVGLLLAGWLTFKPLLYQQVPFTELIVAQPTLGWAVILTGLILSYDFILKHFPIVRELAMGTCRAINFMLGLTFGASVCGAPETIKWLLPLVLLVYVAALTAVSRLENRIPSVRIAIKWLVLGIIVVDTIFVAAFHGPLLALWVLALLVPSLVLGKIFSMA